MMNAIQIRAWIINGKPRPTSLRVRSGKEVNTLPASGSWLRLAQSIEAMQPDLVEALDKDGGVLRAIRPQDVEEKDDDDAKPKPSTDGIPVEAFDPETVRWKLFAELLSEAYKTSSASNTAAFQHLVNIAEIGARRAEAAEKTLATVDRMRRQELELRMEEIEELAEKSGGDAGLFGQMMQAFMGGQNASPKPPNGANGKGH